MLEWNAAANVLPVLVIEWTAGFLTVMQPFLFCAVKCRSHYS